MRQGYKHFFVPAENVYELEYVPGIIIYPLTTFWQIVQYFLNGEPLTEISEAKDIQQLYQEEQSYDLDLEHIK